LKCASRSAITVAQRLVTKTREPDGGAVGQGRDRMSSDLAGDFVPPRASRAGVQKVAIVAAKLLVTGACFWYVSRQVDWRQTLSTIPLLDWRWAALAPLIAMLQVPLLGLRWRNIVDALAPDDTPMTRTDMIAATAVGMFFAQVLPSVAGEGVRAWLLVRLGSNWRKAVTSVVIDRGIGVGLLIAFGLLILLLPSGLTALGGYRDLVLVVYGALISAGALALVVAPKIVPLLARWRYSRWMAILAVDVHRVLFGSKGPVILSIGCLIHALTIVAIWTVGRAQGFSLPLADAAVLFTVMIGVVLVPISIGGWGLRELAVVSLLAAYGVAPEKALLFSVCYGLALAVGSLPGAPVWLLYPFAAADSSRREEQPRPLAETHPSGPASDIA
jgi:glycosyltransferase 2 family protein